MPSLIPKLFNDGANDTENQRHRPTQSAIGNLAHRPQNEINQTSENENKTDTNTHNISFLVLECFLHLLYIVYYI